MQRSNLSTLRELWQYRDMVKNLVAKDIKVRYMGAALGFAWSFGNPLMFTLVYLFVFTQIFPTQQPNFALFVVTGVLHWTLFAQTIVQSNDFLVQNVGLIKKIYFPRTLLPLAGTAVTITFWVISLTIYFMLFPVLGGNFGPWLWVYPLVVFAYIAFILGVSFILSVANVQFRDIKHICEVLIQIMFWATPIVYNLQTLPDYVRKWLIFNPLTHFMQAFQTILYYQHIPDASNLLIIGLLALASLTCGLWYFQQQIYPIVDKL